VIWVFHQPLEGEFLQFDGFFEKKILKHPLNFTINTKEFKTPLSKNSGYAPAYLAQRLRQSSEN